jgi:hypothetical protein
MGLLNPPRSWDFAAMRLSAVIRWFLRWFLVLGISVGVVIGPAVPLVAAAASALTATMTTAATDDDAMQTPDDMPCCPKNQAPMPFDCDKCALSSCMLKISGPSQIGAIVDIPVVIARIAPVSEVAPAGLAKPPPERPPRANV